MNNPLPTHCKQCGCSIDQVGTFKPRSFCSRLCRQRHSNAGKTLVQATANCAVCAKEIPATSRRGLKRKFCSKKCNNVHQQRLYKIKRQQQVATEPKAKVQDEDFGGWGNAMDGLHKYFRGG